MLDVHARVLFVAVVAAADAISWVGVVIGTVTVAGRLEILVTGRATRDA